MADENEVVKKNIRWKRLTNSFIGACNCFNYGSCRWDIFFIE